jgi:hypothetical protein
MPDIGEAVTRKLGPLPVWMWAIVIGGGIVLMRALRGGTDTSAGVTYVPVGNPEGSTGTATDTMSYPNLTTPVLSVASFKSYNTLLVQLTGLLSKRQAIIADIIRIKDAIAGNERELTYNASLTTEQKATLAARIARGKELLSAQSAAKADLDTQVTDLQTQMGTTAVGSGT